MRLGQNTNGWISVFDMKDGDVAVIRQWDTSNTNYVGRIVQRYGDDLITLGAPSGNGWDYGWMRNQKRGSVLLMVEPLKPGTTLIV